MKIIKQYFEPLTDGTDLVDQIGKRARICYQSEPAGDETKMVQSLIKRRHDSTLEMGVVHLLITVKEDASKFRESKYLVVDHLHEQTYLVTGTIRAWREFIRVTSLDIEELYSIIFLLQHEFPIFFSDTDTSLITSQSIPNINVQLLSDTELAKLGKHHSDIFKRHQFQAIKFITNRAVTHEIVRHRPVTYLQESQRYCRYANDVVFIEPTAFNFNKEEMFLWISHMELSEKTYIKLLKTKSPQASRLVLPNSCKTEIIVYCSLRQWTHIFAMRCSPAAEPSMQEAMYPVKKWMSEQYPEYFVGEMERSVG